VWCAETRLADHAQSVVLLQEELPRSVEAEGERPLLFEQLLRTLDDQVKGLVPARLDQLAILPDERAGEPVFGVVGLPTKEILWVDPAFVDPVYAPAADADDTSVLDGDVQGITIGVEDGGCLHPTVNLFL
jgi:hypothetical protein